MADWYDPASWKSAAEALAALVKLRNSLRRKTAAGPEVPRVDAVFVLEKVTALTDTITRVVELDTKAKDATRRVIEAHFQAIMDMDRRLKALEKAASKQKPRKPTKRKGRT